jgi:hypothetical protein
MAAASDILGGDSARRAIWRAVGWMNAIRRIYVSLAVPRDLHRAIGLAVPRRFRKEANHDQFAICTYYGRKH